MNKSDVSEKSKFIKENKKYRTLFAAAVSLLFWIGVWAILYFIADMDYLLPAPWTVIWRTVRLFGEKTFLISALFSVIRVFAGFIIGAVVGLLFALLMRVSEFCHTVIVPLLTVIKSTPVASFILLLWVFTGEQILPSVIAALIVIPIMTQNVYTGINNVNKKNLEVCRVYNLTKSETLINSYLPDVYSYFSSACITAVGMAWKAACAAEVLAYVRYSLGREIYLSRSLLNTVDLFAYTLSVVILSYIIEKAVKLFFERTSKND